MTYSGGPQRPVPQRPRFNIDLDEFERELRRRFMEEKDGSAGIGLALMYVSKSLIRLGDKQAGS